MQQFFKLIIEYDGTNYYGWQIQAQGPTVQQAVEDAVFKITGCNARIYASGRTDSGVHALGQCAHFTCDTSLEPAMLQKALNAVLPDDIAIKACENVDADFHARFSAKSKRYRYTIWNGPAPLAIGRQYVWQIRKPLNIAAMQTACAKLVGEHDFKGFETTGTPHNTTVRKVLNAQISQNGDYVYFEIEATGFLRYMVRGITGTLAEIGLGQRSPQDIDLVLTTGNRDLAGATAPPQGLALLYVTY